MRTILKAGILVLTLAAMPIAAQAGTVEGAAIGAGSFCGGNSFTPRSASSDLTASNASADHVTRSLVTHSSRSRSVVCSRMRWRIESTRTGFIGFVCRASGEDRRGFVLSDRELHALKRMPELLKNQRLTGNAQFCRGFA